MMLMDNLQSQGLSMLKASFKIMFHPYAKTPRMFCSSARAWHFSLDRKMIWKGPQKKKKQIGYHVGMGFQKPGNQPPSHL